jgi:dihydroflavonol-4-reductase
MAKAAVQLVTGSAGLVGRELVMQLLGAGQTVRALYHNRVPDLPKHDNLELVQGDLLDVVEIDEWMEGVQQVYHCAGLIKYTPGSRNELYQINVVATANLVNACLRNSVKKLVHVSSIAALGRSDALISEDTKWSAQNNNSVYGESKYWGEMEVWRGAAEGLDVVIVNPGIILGPGDWNEGSTAIFRNIWKGFNWYSTGINGFVGVRDVVLAMLQLMQSDISQERFILVAENRSYREVFFGIADAFGTSRPTRKVVPILAELVWRFEWFKSKITGKEPLVTKETARAALGNSIYDNRKLLHCLPEFRYEELNQTLEYCCRELMKKNGLSRK